MMNWTEIPETRSKQVAAIGRDASSKTTAIRYRGGAPYDYHYHDVEQADHDRFIAAQSLGSHLHQHFKGKVRFTKVDRAAHAKEEADRQFGQPHYGHGPDDV